MSLEQSRAACQREQKKRDQKLREELTRLGWKPKAVHEVDIARAEGKAEGRREVIAELRKWIDAWAEASTATPRMVPPLRDKLNELEEGE